MRRDFALAQKSKQKTHERKTDMARRGSSKVGAKARKLKARARQKFIKATTKIDVKSAKARGKQRLKNAKRKRR